MKKIILILIFLLCPILSLAGSFGRALNDTTGLTAIDIKDDIVGGYYVCDSTGALDSMLAYIGNSSTALNFKCAIRRASDYSLVDSSAVTEIPIGAQFGWKSFQFVNGATVKEDTAYYLCLWADSLNETHYTRTKREDASVGDIIKYRQYDFANGWAATETWTATWTDYGLPIRAYYTTEGEEPPAENNVVHFREGHYRKISR